MQLILQPLGLGERAQIASSLLKYYLGAVELGHSKNFRTAAKLHRLHLTGFSVLWIIAESLRFIRRGAGSEVASRRRDCVRTFQSVLDWDDKTSERFVDVLVWDLPGHAHLLLLGDDATAVATRATRAVVDQHFSPQRPENEEMQSIQELGIRVQGLLRVPAVNPLSGDGRAASRQVSEFGRQRDIAWAVWFKSSR